MKKAAYILAGLFLLFSCKQKKEEKEVVIEETTVQETAPAQKECFLKVVGKDSIILKVERKANDSIYGIFDWKPYEKDKKISTYKGIIKDGKAQAIASYQAEGMEYDEELFFTIEANKAFVQYGITEQGPDGIWRYKDTDPASVQVLDKAECR